MNYDVATLDIAGGSISSLSAFYVKSIGLVLTPKMDAAYIMGCSGRSLELKVLPFLMVCKLFRIATVLNFVGGMAPEKAKNWGFIKKLAFRMADKVVVPTNTFLKGLLDAGIKGNFCVIPHFVDIHIFESVDTGADRKPILLAAKEIGEGSGYEFLIEAYGLVIQKVPEAQFVIAGSGALERDMKKLALAKDLPDISFRGNVPHREMVELFSQASVLVHGTKYESFGITLVEAMAAGTPPVAFAVGGIPDIIENGETGYTVPYGDTGMFADRVIKLLDTPNLRKEMGEKARRDAQKYKW
ncbi:glycosyltransferase family 4 protein, partial [Fibrobacterota bacterium]